MAFLSRSSSTFFSISSVFSSVVFLASLSADYYFNSFSAALFILSFKVFFIKLGSLLLVPDGRLKALSARSSTLIDSSVFYLALSSLGVLVESESALSIAFLILVFTLRIGPVSSSSPPAGFDSCSFSSTVVVS